VTTGIYFLVTLLFPLIRRWLPIGTGSSSLRVRYPDGRGILRQVLVASDLDVTDE
jgi:hypothetical protein